MALPKRWEPYSNVGKVIPDTRIICFKVPLKERLVCQMPKKLRFTPAMLVADLKAKGQRLGLVIDLTNTTRYYDKREIISHSIHYEKIFCEGKIVPQFSVVKQFNSIIDSFYKENAENDLLIGIHCTHGLNRTGYLVCRYMIEKLGYEPEDAFKVFEEARGEKMEKPHYLEDLRGRGRIIESDDKELLPGIQPSIDQSEDRRPHRSNSHRPADRGYCEHPADRGYCERPGGWYSDSRREARHLDRPRYRQRAHPYMHDQRFQRDDFYPPQPFFTNTPFREQYLEDQDRLNNRYSWQAGQIMGNQSSAPWLPSNRPQRFDDDYHNSNNR